MIIDLQKFINEERPCWSELEAVLDRLENKPEARLALGFASVADRVKPYAQISLRQLLVSHAGDAMQAALPVWLDDFAAADRKARNRLSDTLRAYADADMNVLQAAKRLGVHPNTIYSRVQRISDITGQDPMSYHELTEMLLALDCIE